MGELGLQLRLHSLQRRLHLLPTLRFIPNGVMMDNGIVQLRQQRKHFAVREGVLSGKQ